MILCALSVLGGLNLQHLDRELPVFHIADAFQERQRRRVSEVKFELVWGEVGHVVALPQRSLRSQRKSLDFLDQASLAQIDQQCTF
jgi:hypothetical protein